MRGSAARDGVPSGGEPCVEGLQFRVEPADQVEVADSSEVRIVLGVVLQHVPGLVGAGEAQAAVRVVGQRAVDDR
jgi:hypothetical protein